MERSRFRVAIVGAGVAGVTAANELIRSGKLKIDDICVLEAQDRIGGRVRSKPFSEAMSAIVEVGAAWIHGIEGNVFMARAASFGIEPQVVSPLNPWLHPAPCKNFLLYDGETLLSDQETATTWVWYETLLNKLEKLANGDEAKKLEGTSVAVIVQKLLKEDEELSEIVASAPNSHMRIELCLRLAEVWMGTVVEKLNLSDFSHVDHIGDDPGPHCFIPVGMERFIDNMAVPINQAIQTKTPVKTIYYGSDDGVLLECTDGKRIEADYVIVTSALGFLKARKLHFKPSLPEEKLNAIDRSQMGQYMKIMVQFPTVFWPEDAKFIAQIRKPESKGAGLLHFPLLLNYYAAKRIPALEGVLIGDVASEVSSRSDEEIVAQFYKQLQLTYGENIPKLVDHFITRWDQDPWSLGAYSCLNVKSTAEDPETIRQTVAGKVLFAGEATCYKYQGSLQGAYVSGLEAVKELGRLGAC